MEIRLTLLTPVLIRRIFFSDTYTVPMLPNMTLFALNIKTRVIWWLNSTTYTPSFTIVHLLKLRLLYVLLLLLFAPMIAFPCFSFHLKGIMDIPPNSAQADTSLLFLSTRALKVQLVDPPATQTA